MNLKEAMAEFRETQNALDTMYKYKDKTIKAIVQPDTDDIIKALESHLDLLSKLKIEI